MNLAFIIPSGTFPETPDDELVGFPTLQDAFDGLPASNHTIEHIVFFEGQHEWTSTAKERLKSVVIESNATSRDVVIINLGNGFELDGQEWLFRNVTLVSSIEQDEALIRLKNGAKITFENCSLTTHNPRYFNEPRWPPAPPLRTFEAWDSVVGLYSCDWHSDGVGATTWGEAEIEICDTAFTGHSAGAPCVLAHGKSVLIEGMNSEYRSPLSLFRGKATIRNSRFGEEDKDWRRCSYAIIYGGKARFENCELLARPGIVLDGPQAQAEVVKCTFQTISTHHLTPEYHFCRGIEDNFVRPHLMAICNFESALLEVRDCIFPEEIWMKKREYRHNRSASSYGLQVVRGVTGYVETTTDRRIVEKPAGYDDESRRLGVDHSTSEVACREMALSRGLLSDDGSELLEGNASAQH